MLFTHSCVWVSVTPWIVARQGPLSIGFPRQESWVAICSSKESSQPRDWICVSCIGRWISYHCATWEAPDAAYHALSCLSVETQQRLWPQLLPVPVFRLLTILVFTHVALRGRPCLLSLGLMSIINLIFLILSSISYFDSPWLTISLKKKRKIKHKFPTYVSNFNAALLTHTLLSSYTEPLAIP